MVYSVRRLVWMYSVTLAVFSSANCSRSWHVINLNRLNNVPMMFRCHDVPKIMLFNKHVVVAAFARSTKSRRGSVQCWKASAEGFAPLRSLSTPNVWRATGDHLVALCVTFSFPLFWTPFFCARDLDPSFMCPSPGAWSLRSLPNSLTYASLVGSLRETRPWKVSAGVSVVSGDQVSGCSEWDGS